MSDIVWLDYRAVPPQTSVMQSTTFRCFCVLASLVSVSAAEKTISVTVNAGDFDRRGTVATINLPDSVKSDALLVRRDGSRVPFQIGKDRRAEFVLDD